MVPTGGHMRIKIVGALVFGAMLGLACAGPASLSGDDLHKADAALARMENSEVADLARTTCEALTDLELGRTWQCAGLTQVAGHASEEVRPVIVTDALNVWV